MEHWSWIHVEAFCGEGAESQTTLPLFDLLQGLEAVLLKMRHLQLDQHEPAVQRLLLEVANNQSP